MPGLAHGASQRKTGAEEDFSLSMTSEFVGSVSAHDEFELGPETIVSDKPSATVVIVLQAETGELRWVPGEIRRETATIDAVLRDDGRRIAGHLLAPQAEYESRLHAPQQLGVATLVLQ